MYEYPVTVEFEDVDSYQIAHHTKIIAYLERARVHFIVDQGVDITGLGFGPVLVDLSIQFKRPLLMLDSCVVEVRSREIEKFHFKWDYVIRKDGKKAVTATIKQAFIDLETRRLIPIPGGMIEMLKKIEILPAK
jgi:YbgC/YbaW family acyl-CoA thioester hydrolase